MRRRDLIVGRGSADADARSVCEACGNQTTRRNLLCRRRVLGSAWLWRRPGAGDRPTSGRKPATNLLIDATNRSRSPGDIPASPILAWPMEPETKLVRTGSRLNKIVLVRPDPATLAEPTRERAADGVVAYSAICPHAGCEVNGWVAEQGILECPCHNSRYDPRDAAAIVDGPTTRALAALPLKIADGKLIVARPFIGRLGIAPT